jgi:two-component system, cell cycle response regulator
MASLAPGKTAIAVPSERPKGPGQPCLLIIAGPGMGRRIDLTAEPVEIGRAEDCTISVQSPQISRKHAAIQRIVGKYWVVDLKSTNGTFVNDEKVKQRTLADGDKIKVGELVLKYMESNLELQYHEQILNLANLDPLTNVFNKRVFEMDAAEEAEANDAKPLSLLLFDIDHFKRLNDTHGHPGGDEVLKGVAELTKNSVPTGGSAYRVGGEEFAILLRATPLAKARELGESLRQTVADRAFEFDGKQISVTISVGVAELKDGETSADLYKRTDERLYAAKGGGRNRVES